MGSRRDRGGSLEIFQAFINFCWFLFKWGLLAGVLAVVVAVPYLYRRVDDEIRRCVEARFAEQYPDLMITVRAAQLIEGEGIEAQDISIVEPGAKGPRAEIVHVEELFLTCRGDLEELITGEPAITHVLISRPTIRVTRRLDGNWSVSKLLPPAKLTHAPCPVRIENGSVEIFDPLKSPTQTLTLRHLNLTITPPPQVLRPGGDPQLPKFKGTLTGDFFRQARLEGFLDPDRLSWTVSGAVEGLEVSPELAAAVPDPWAEKLTLPASLRGQGTLDFNVTHDPVSPVPYRFDLSGRLSGARIDDPRLPHPLTDMHAGFRATNDGYVIEDLFAAGGQATLRMSCRAGGYDNTSPLWLEAEIRQLELDQQLMEILPEVLKDQWSRYLPSGQIHADVQLSFDGQDWHPEVSIQCLNVAVSYYKFPYRLQQCTGSVALEDDVLRAQFTGYGGTQPVEIKAEVLRPLSAPSGWCTAQGRGIQIDEKLFSAIKEEPRAVARSLDPRGAVDLSYRVWREHADHPWHRHLLVGLNRLWMKYDKFPYPLSNVIGTLEMVDNRWTFENLQGTNDTGRVTWGGYLESSPEGNNLLLNLTGNNIPLEEELRDALRKPDTRRLWNDLKLTGAVDITAEVRQLPGDPQASVSFRAQPRGESTSIEPISFPYRMEKIAGLMTYNNGHVTLERFKAEHGHTTISTDGTFDLLPDGSRKLKLENMAVDRLHADRDLIQALPERLKKSVVGLSPGGPLDLRGTIEFARGSDPNGPLTSAWDLDLGFHQGSLDCGAKLENINGQMDLSGSFDGTRMRSSGELAIDSVTYKHIQFTDVRGPLSSDDDRVLLGALADQQQSRQTHRDITAKAFGGTVFSRGWVARGEVPRFRLQANLSGANLARCAQEVLPGHQDLSGKVRAAVDLWGEGRSLNSLGGAGRIELRDADIYELPVMISLLKILSVRPPDQSAFSESDIDFTIQGPHLYFSRMNFNGDAISLEGRGEMNFDSDIRLTFRSRLGLRQLNVPLLKDILGGASEQIMLIHVSGKIQDPITKKEPFPTLTQALHQFQNDLQQTAAGPNGLLPQAGHLMLNNNRAPPGGS